MPANGHALLSASSSKRWLNCPPSARLSENYEDKTSDFALEGSCAHELAEFRLKEALGLKAENPIENLDYYDQDMEEYVAGYVGYIMEIVEEEKKTCPDVITLVEQRLDYSRFSIGFFSAFISLQLKPFLNSVVCDHY